MNNKIQEMIKLYEEDKDFFGPVSDEHIIEIENKLGIYFPSNYRSFIRCYGSGGICGVSILGIEGDLGASVQIATERYRKLELRRDLIVIEDLGEFVMCSETADQEKIINWDSVQKRELIGYNDFDEYLSDSFQEAIDNWD